MGLFELLQEPGADRKKKKKEPVESGPVQAQEPQTARIGRLEPKYTQEYLRWKQTKDPRDLDALLRKMYPTIDQFIMRYSGAPGKNMPVLRAHAKAILAKSLDKYDPKRATLTSFAANRLQELQRKYRPLATPLKLSERESILSSRLQRAERELTEELGREPSTAELADYTGISIKKIESLRNGGFLTIGAYEEGGTGIAAVQNGNEPDRKWLEYVYYSLPEGEDRLILEYLYGLHGRKRLSVIATAKKLKKSPAYVSRRKQEIDRLASEVFGMLQERGGI